jgi:hypothetical protein
MQHGTVTERDQLVDLEERTSRLATAGVELIRPWPPGDDHVTPVDVAWGATGCGPESGRVDRAFDDDDPERVEKGNAAWLELSQRYGLFDPDGTFLVSVSTGDDDEPEAHWFQARLGQTWDVVGLGAEQRVLGFGWAVPSFVMHSTDGETLIAATWYERSFSVFAIPHPIGASGLRRAAEIWLAREDWPGERRAITQRWLARGRG